MKAGIFGFGDIYRRYAPLLPEELSVVVILDNGVTDHEEEVDGVAHINPKEVMAYDVDLIILMSNFAAEMRKQLEDLGFDMSKVVHYRNFFGGLEQKRQIYPANEIANPDSGSMLIISNDLGFHGAPVTVLGMIKCARKLGYRVSVAASSGNQTFIEELNLAGANVIIQPWIEHASWENLKWTDEYDEVIVNSLPVIACAIRVAAHRRTILWLHESPDAYRLLQYWRDEIQNGIYEENLQICAVSNRAIENLKSFFEYDRRIKILLPYVQDWCDNEPYAEKGDMAFAVVAPFIECKGQHIILKAIPALSHDKSARFVFVGKSSESPYSQEMLVKISEDSFCEYLGEMTRGEISHLYKSVDAVIVPSMEETLSLVAVEAMMMKKVCIVSDHCGIAEYIRNGENGFVFPLNDVNELVKIIEWCLDNKEKCLDIGYNARKTYEDNFSLKRFENSFKEILIDIDR